VDKSQTQSQVEIATKAKWALEGKIIEGRITSESAKDWFDEETELEGRQDYEADYKKVLHGLEHPCLHLRKDIAQMNPVIGGIVLDDPMSNQELSFSGSNLFERAGRGAVERASRELSDVPVASPECPKSFHLLPNFWQQMHRRRLRKKTNVTVPNIDIWGLDTHEHDEEEEDDFAPPHTYFDRRLNILFLSSFSLFVFYLSTKVKGFIPPHPQIAEANNTKEHGFSNGPTYGKHY